MPTLSEDVAVGPKFVEYTKTSSCGTLSVVPQGTLYFESDTELVDDTDENQEEESERALFLHFIESIDRSDENEELDDIDENEKNEGENSD